MGNRDTGGMSMSLTHLSLFSGIGGLDLAAEWAGFETVGQCEFADYPTKVLEKHWPNVPRWKDVRELTAKSIWERTGLKEITVISGGFPCQPHSLAGKRKASADERDLWPEYRRIIGKVNPRWIVAENVPGLLSSEDGRFFRGILRDLSEMGFNVGWCTYPAAWVGAIHRRERIFIIAYSNAQRLQGRLLEKKLQKADEQSERAYLHLLGRANAQYLSQSAILRKSNGIPYRVDRTQCLGNAVVPQQAYPIFKAIAEIERMVECG
jgi:DNA (cytosine-5)-methyltransferase 1